MRWIWRAEPFGPSKALDDFCELLSSAERIYGK